MRGSRRPGIWIENAAMLVAVLGLGAASGVAWKTIVSTGQSMNASVSVAREPILATRVVSDFFPTPPPFIRTKVVPPSISADLPPRRVFVRPSPIGLPMIRPRPCVEPPEQMLGEPRRVRVADADGIPTVARVYGGIGSRIVVLPDGQLGWPNGMIYTDEPFRPKTVDEMAESLSNTKYKHFQLVKTDHYLIFHTSSPEFARRSGQLLESLYRGLTKKFRELGLPVRDAEFPLVAVIYRNESEFRENRDVANQVTACYDAISNEIAFFETKDREAEPPEAAALRKPQTVAHEGTHQVLQNIGVQPRLAPWPSWLVEGLAEYGSATTTNRAGEWAGFGHVNPSHVATFKELEDTMALQGRDRRLTRKRVGDAPGRQVLIDLLARDDLTPTDYSLAWGLTHYLANRRCDDFVAYLKSLGEMQPLEETSPENRVRAFVSAFGGELTAMSQHWVKYVSGMRRGDAINYYTVLFEQKMDDGLLRRGTMVSQSPQMISEWLDGMAMGVNAPYKCKALEFPTRAAAISAAEKWTGGR